MYKKKHESVDSLSVDDLFNHFSTMFGETDTEAEPILLRVYLSTLDQLTIDWSTCRPVHQPYINKNGIA